MKILVTIKYQSPKYISLLSALKKKQSDVVFSTDINQQVLDEIKPDLIISDSANYHGDITHLLLYSEQQPDRPTDLGFCLDILEPFVDPELFVEPKRRKLYESEIVYIGDTKKLGPYMQPFLDMKRKVKFFGEPDNLWCYCGMAPPNAIKDIYFSSDCPIVLPDEKQEQYNIIMSHGRPCVVKNEQDLYDGLKGKRGHLLISREEILKKHTNWNRLNFILNNQKLKVL